MIYTSQKIQESLDSYAKGGPFPKFFFRNVYGERKPGIVFNYSHEELTEYAKCANDVVYFASKYCKILTDDGVQQIHLRPYQVEMLHNYQQQRFYSILSSRQMGITTMINILILHELIFGYDKAVFLASPKLLNSQESLDKIREMCRNLPFFLKPGLLKADHRNLVFENGNRLKIVSSKNPFSGFQVHRAFLTDFGAYAQEEAETLIRALFPTIAAIQDSKIVISNTGRPSLVFHRLVQDSERKEGDPQKNSFFTQRAYWWEIPERDANWKNEQIRMLGSLERFDEEYDLCFRAKS